MRETVLAACALLVAGTAVSAQTRRGPPTREIAIRSWLVRGPLPADTGAAGVTRDYVRGEAVLLPTVGDSVAGGAWVRAEGDRIGRVDLNQVFGVATDWSAAYAHVYIHAPRDRTVLLIMDSDDDLVARLNGQRVWVNVVARGLGRGTDTATVRLAQGWNSLLLKAINRTGGFGLLGRLTVPGSDDDLGDLRLAIGRPQGMQAHNYPAPTVTVGPARSMGRLSWTGGELRAVVRLPVVGWGPGPLRGVTLRLVQAGSTFLSESFEALPPGEPTDLELALPFARLRRSAVGGDAVLAMARWENRSARVPVSVSADRLLRALGGRIEIDWRDVDSAAQVDTRLSADLSVPPELDGSSVDLLARGLGPRAQYVVNGREMTWRDGRIELCAACRAGDGLSVEVLLERDRPVWLLPVARVGGPGYAEFADGYDYALALAGQEPEVDRPDPVTWLRIIGRQDRAAYRQLIERHLAAHAPLAELIRRDTLLLVGNSHIDAAWLWRWRETVDVIRDTWRTSLKLGAIFPGYVFAASSAAFYEAMDRHEPALADSLRAAVDDGMWAIVGGWWVEPDLNLPHGESLVRQGLYGQRYFERRYGRRARVAWTPDSFGYPWTLPQILKGQGFEHFVTQKIRWNDSTEFAHNAFYWEGRDGSRIFSYNPYGYVHDLDPRSLVEERIEDRERTGGHHQIVVYGVGDHGGGPTIEMLERAEDLRRVPTFPVLRYARPYEALTTVEGGLPDREFAVWRDELYLEYHRGTYTTQAAIKRRNRRSEALLQTAEALAAVDTASYPRDRLEAAWRRVLFNQFHDILPGSGIPEIYVDANAWYDTAWAILDTITTTAFDRLRARMDTRVGGRPVVVFNPLGWTRGGRITLVDEGGDTLTATVDSVPAFGARALRLPDDGLTDSMRALPPPSAGPGWIENAYLRVEVDTLTGTITRLYDRIREREVLAPGGRGNVLQIFDDRPAQWDAWNVVITGERWDVTDVTGLDSRADARTVALDIERSWGGSTFHQRLVLERGSPMLEIRNDVEWREDRKLLKVAFALNIDADSATYEIPYGTIGRSGDPRTQAERAKFEVPGQRWADVSDPDYGVSLINDSKYGWDYHGNVLRLSLLRAPVWPDSLADRGRHRFRFAVYPHTGDWRAAETDRRAAEYNVPLVAGFEPGHRGPLGRRFSPVSARSANVHLAWLKRAEDSDAYVIRLVEYHGSSALTTLTFDCPVRSARRADLLERPDTPAGASGRVVTLSMRPYQIETLLVECER